jgi:molybdopterin-containing oxidoreductase family iron-sulfur binding subunit
MNAAKWGMVIDLDRCTGCGVCVSACRLENNIPPQASARPTDWITVESRDNAQAFPQSDSIFLPKPCMHCENPPCVRACPVGATVKSGQGGIVSQTYARCIGCRACMKACPYGVRRFTWTDPSWPRGMGEALTPYASVRPKGVVEKCTLCSHRLMLAGPGGYVTACAEACPTGAIRAGSVEELRRGLDAFVLLPGEKTSPQVFYMTRRAWMREKPE